MEKTQYMDAMLREAERGKINLLLAVKAFPNHKEFDNTDAALDVGSLILCMVERMTPLELMRMFPITKRFDGYKSGGKDYFDVVRMITDYGTRQSF